MAYFLRKDKKKERIYLQMYENYWDKEKKQARTKHVETFGYVDELVSDNIKDPIPHFKKYVEEKNEERRAFIAEKTRPRAFSSQPEKHLGYFLLYSLLEELDVKQIIDILAAQMRFQFSIYDMLSQLIYARVISPCSKSRTVSSVFPHLYQSVHISEDQVYDGLAFI